MFRDKKTLITVIVSAVVLIAAVVAGLLFFFNSKTNPLPEKIASSQVGSGLEEITTVNGNKFSSLMIASASNEWWERMLKYGSNVKLYDLEFADVAEDAVYIASTVSQGDSYASLASVGMSTFYLVYKDEEAAIEVEQFLLNNPVVPFDRAGNFIIFPVIGAFTDVDFVLDSFRENENFISDSELLVNDEALMVINFDEYRNLYKQYTDGYDSETLDTLTAMFGIVEETNWVGVSKDGLEWEGDFYNLQLDKVESPSIIDSFIASTLMFYDLDNKLRPASEATENNQSGLMESKQSLLITNGDMSVRNTEEVAVSSAEGIENSLKTSGEPLGSGEGLYEVAFNINNSLAAFKSDDVIYPYSPFASLTITVMDWDGSSKFVFAPGSEEQQENWKNFYGEIYDNVVESYE